MATDSNSNIKPLVTKLRKRPVPPVSENPEPMSSLFAEATDAYATSEDDEDKPNLSKSMQNKPRQNIKNPQI